MTEWLETDGSPVLGLGFDPTGRRIAAGTQEQVTRVWEFPPVPTPVPAWFIQLAEAVAGVRLGTHGNVELVPREEMTAPGEHARKSTATDFYTAVAKWFLADPARRPLDPF